MAHWVKKLRACQERDIGRTRMDELIALGYVRAKKEGSARNAPVLVDLDSIDAYREKLPDAQGHIAPEKRRRRAARTEAATA